jgi:hypothetical protein
MLVFELFLRFEVRDWLDLLLGIVLITGGVVVLLLFDI